MILGSGQLGTNPPNDFSPLAGRITRRHENYVEHLERGPDNDRSYLVSARHQRVTRKLHDRPDEMGSLRRGRRSDRCSSRAGGQPKAVRR